MSTTIPAGGLDKTPNLCLAVREERRPVTTLIAILIVIIGIPVLLNALGGLFR
jgi:hypothetical protein